MTEKCSSLDYKMIKRVCGDIPEWKIVLIEGSSGSAADLDIALA